MLHKGGRTETVWFYDVAADGESLNAKRTPQPESNDLWDLAIHYRLRQGLDAPAFVDGAAWEGWQALDEETRAKRYAQPSFATVEDEDDEGNVVALEVLDAVEQVEIEEAKTWIASTDDLIGE